MSYTQEELKETRLDDFRVFLFQVWDHLQLRDRNKNLCNPTDLQQDIAGFLQHGPRRRMVMGFRGVAKSWITVAFVLWTLLLDPQKKIMVVSASEGLALDFVKFCRQLIDEMEILQHLRPGPGQEDKAEKFEVGPARASKDPSLKSVSITGQLTGSRADLIVSDDVEVPKNSLTHNMREKLAKLTTEYDDVLKPDGHIIYLGTPQTEQSLYLLLPARGYTIMVWPSQIPVDVNKYQGRLAPYITKMIEAGAVAYQPTEPTRFDETDLAERKLAKGVSSYMLQFMLDTTLSDADKRPLKCRDMIVTDVDEGDERMGPQGHIKYVWTREREKLIQELNCGGMDGDAYYGPAWKSPEMALCTGTVCWIDPSGRGADETAFAIVRYLLGKLFLVKVGGFRDGFGEKTLASIAGACGRYGVNDIIIEKNYGGGMFDSLFKPVLSRVSKARILSKEDDDDLPEWSSTQKELRICDTLEPILQSHRLIVDRRVIEEDWIQAQEEPKYSLIYQWTRMERTKACLAHEDRLEAVAGACSYFIDKMARDQDKVLSDHKSNAIDAELKKWGQKKANRFVVGLNNGSGGDLRSCLR